MKTKTKIKELDLHGVQHVNVEDTLYDFFFWQNNDECEIITGNSKQMKEIVIQWLDYNGFNYSFSPNNLGRIVVTYSLFD